MSWFVVIAFFFVIPNTIYEITEIFTHFFRGLLRTVQAVK